MPASVIGPDISRLSYSSTSAYLTCGRWWKFRYVERIPVLTAVRLIFGRVLHDTIEAYIRSAAEGRDGPPLTGIWEREWTRSLEQEGGNIDWGDDNSEDLCATGLHVLQTPEVVETIAGLTPLVSPYGHIYVEEWVSMKVPGVPVPVIGRIDIITDDGVPGDFKSTSRPWSDEQAMAELQPLFYLSALRQRGLPYNEEMRFRHYVFTTSEQPTAQVIETQRHPDELPFLFEMIREVWQGISAGVFVPNPGAWKCSPKYCEYWAMCRGKVADAEG